MNWKNFFKLTIVKIILLIILFSISSLYVYPVILTPGLHNENERGLPLIFYGCTVGFRGEATPFCTYNYTFLAIDLIFWYLISCFTFWIFNVVKKK